MTNSVIHQSSRFCTNSKYQLLAHLLLGLSCAYKHELNSLGSVLWVSPFVSYLQNRNFPGTFPRSRDKNITLHTPRLLEKQSSCCPRLLEKQRTILCNKVVKLNNWSWEAEVRISALDVCFPKRKSAQGGLLAEVDRDNQCCTWHLWMTLRLNSVQLFLKHLLALSPN